MKFHEIDIDAGVAAPLTSIGAVLPLKDLLPQPFIGEIEKLKLGQISNLVIHGLPVPGDLPDTPVETTSLFQNEFPSFILKSIAEFLGATTQGSIENVVRPRMGGLIPEEPWHAHEENRFSLFYCLRGDSHAVTYLSGPSSDAVASIVYKSGDLAIYDERATRRFSPAYAPDASVAQDRWLLALGVPATNLE